ncbi:sialic acid-binding Ig-like lectin 11 [Elephas maximus indicus]|uniref:sialic acid-binding Ig-like lectin 11 n=1 Tax=Elephas maximus indicus TaxID=99487 RepID=UPI002116448A|nr:sialic acid-binding Ig-like lectin 11 [Elephas maximus indicus]
MGPRVQSSREMPGTRAPQCCLESCAQVLPLPAWGFLSELPSQNDRWTQKPEAARSSSSDCREMCPRLLLLLLLLWGIKCVGGWGSQAGAGAPINPQSPLGSLDLDDKYQLQVQKSVTVQEGLCVFIPCTFSYPPDGWDHSDPVLGFWFKEQANPKLDPLVATNNPKRQVKPQTAGRFQLVGNPQNGSCSLVIRNTRKRDTATYFFQVERGNGLKYSFLKNKLSLQVTGLTQKPDVYIPDTLEMWCLTTLFCVFPRNSEGYPAPKFSWSGAAVSPQRARPRGSLFSELTLTLRSQDNTTKLTCQVDLSRNSVNTAGTIRPSVAYAAKDIVISISRAKASAPEPQGNISHLEVQKGQFLRLLCAADGQPPAILSWVLDNRVLSWSPLLGPRTLELELPPVGPGDTGHYTCHAENRLGSQEFSLDLSVQYPPENLRVMVSQANRTVLDNFRNGTSLPVLEGQSLRLVCVADSSPPATLSWAWRSQRLSPSQPSDPRVLELPRVQKDDEGEVICQAQNRLGSQHTSLRLSVLYAPQLLSPSCSWEAEGLHCSCSAGARPAPSLRWRVGDWLVEGNSSNASVTVTSCSAGPWANSSLSIRGGLSPGLRLHCEARNDHGAHSVTVLLLPARKPERGREFVQAAFMGAGLAALLFFCSCLIFPMVKTRRKKATKTAPGGSDAPSVLGTIAWGYQQESRPGGSPDCPPPDVATPTSGEQQELHYASLVFHGLRLREPQEATSTTEYSEIKIHQ